MVSFRAQDSPFKSERKYQSSLHILIPVIVAADPHRFDADPDPTFHFDADPDPDPPCHFDADPDSIPFNLMWILIHNTNCHNTKDAR